jgi:CRP/FNR family transcriptional regulator
MDTSIVKRVYLFSTLDDDTLGKIAGIVCERSYKKNEMIFFEGDPGDAVHFVEKGKVKIYKINSGGKEQIIHIMQDGDVFAESVLFTGLDYPANAEALEDSVIGVLKCDKLEELIMENSGLAVSIINFMGRRLQFVSGQIENLGLKDVMGRVASVIVGLADKGAYTPKGIMTDFALSRQEVAGLAGTTRETATRVLSALQKQGCINIEKDKLYIKDIKKLKGLY